MSKKNDLYNIADTLINYCCENGIPNKISYEIEDFYEKNDRIVIDGYTNCLEVTYLNSDGDIVDDFFDEQYFNEVFQKKLSKAIEDIKGIEDTENFLMYG